MTDQFCSICCEQCPRVSWLLASGSAELPHLPEGASVVVNMPKEMLSVFQCLFVLARSCEGLPEQHRIAIAKHVCEQLPREPRNSDAPKLDLLNTLNLRGFFGDAYTAWVYARVIKSGYDCEFVPTKSGHKTPDLVSRDAGVCIECKDSLSEAGFKSSDSDVVRKFQVLVKDAESHFLTFDPECKYEHVIAVDLPEGVVARMKQMDGRILERFARDLFDAPVMSECGTLSPRRMIVDSPMRVMISDCDFGVHMEKSSGSWPREPLWLGPLFKTDVSPRLMAFLTRFLRLDEGGLLPISDADR